MKKDIKSTLFKWLKKNNLIPEGIIDASVLDKGRGLEKQLDEYRELLESIERETGYFSSKQGCFSVSHANELDNYLSHLYELRFGKKSNPNNAITYLRPKPLFIQIND